MLQVEGVVIKNLSRTVLLNWMRLK